MNKRMNDRKSNYSLLNKNATPINKDEATVDRMPADLYKNIFILSSSFS